MATSYHSFLVDRQKADDAGGIGATFYPDNCFDFQRHLIEWSARKGRAAIFSDCGTGKSLMELSWARNIVEHTNGRVLLLTPLAVAKQMQGEGEKFGIECVHSKDGKPAGQITVANYERLHMFDRSDYSAVVCDESSVLKNFDGKRRQIVTDFVRKMQYILLASATPAPNDITELGTSSEAIGEMGYVDMLSKFFRNEQGSIGKMQKFGNRPAKFRLKGHAEKAFWRWVASWARALRKPSDLGFSDKGFALPELITNTHVIESKVKQEGALFDMPAVGLREERDELRRTLQERCETVAELVAAKSASVCWCNTNAEGDLLESIIPDAVQISGSDSLERKEEVLDLFSDGKIRVLIIKPRIGGFGLNWQHCNHMTFFPTHSFEQYYQAVRRCWRFGQKKPVTVDIVASEGVSGVVANLQRKADESSAMFDKIIHYMTESQRIDIVDEHTKKMEIPTWL